jgi:hypothetical protein
LEGERDEEGKQKEHALIINDLLKYILITVDDGKLLIDLPSSA